MLPRNREQAVRILEEAAGGGARLPELPASCRPASIAEALEIQELLAARAIGGIAGWKVARDASGAALWGAIFTADCLPSPASVTGDQWKPFGVEGEIAFRFERDLPCRAEPYTRAELEEALIALPVMEIVSSRFTEYHKAPFLDRLADRMSNGGLVTGAPRPNWRELDLARLRVTLSLDGVAKLDRIGGHAAGDPLLPAMHFIHARQAEKTFEAGQIITTGTFTGLVFAQPGQNFSVDFKEFGSVHLEFGQ